ncbi:hypothetical protein G3T14_06715 [Methylobacterium sp. BTF04]|uniref:DUF6925 family protein n=1 Tax=Methylobacterium sp. BTF04 TaxID=2708300 RepID=UPI0013D0BB13|nr:hypothetical protein [Methylobacterium sp. BTF04]NEU11821.1 hypothetical protein [Methylobacterium sp. BTF04]
MNDDVRALLATALADTATVWTLGGFGALAEFRRDADEPTEHVVGGRFGLVTPRGGLAFDPRAPIVPIAYETALPGGWSHAVALCLPDDRCSAIRPLTVTEIGPDHGALRARDAGAILFDLGLALPQADIHLRTENPADLASLRRVCGHPAHAPSSPVAELLAVGALDFVVVTPLGRIEVFARRAPIRAGAPRGFVVPQILAARRTHVATAPIPHGLVPCAYLQPPHPCRDGGGRPMPFQSERYAAFQALYARWGDPEHVALKHSLLMGAPLAPSHANRRTRALARIARAQSAALAGEPR